MTCRCCTPSVPWMSFEIRIRDETWKNELQYYRCRIKLKSTWLNEVRNRDELVLTIGQCAEDEKFAFYLQAKVLPVFPVKTILHIVIYQVGISLQSRNKAFCIRNSTKPETIWRSRNKTEVKQMIANFETKGMKSKLNYSLNKDLKN